MSVARPEGWRRGSAVLLVVAGLGVLTAAGCTETSVDRASGLAIENVNVIDVVGGEAQEGQTVVVEGDRIVEVAPASAVRLGEGVQRVDGSGRYLIPGLWDMHVHFGMPFARAPARELMMSLAHGVTGVRDLGATPEVFRTLMAWRRDFRAGEVPGPRLHMAGVIVDGDPPARPYYLTATNGEEGRGVVDRLQEMGADFVKVYDGVFPEAFHAIVEEAAGRGLTVAGHVPDAVGPVAASVAGITTLEHADELGFHVTNSKPPAGSDVDSGAHPLARMRAFEHYDEQKAGAVIEAFAGNGTAVVPTLQTVHVLARYGPEDFEEGVLARLVSDKQKRERLDDLPHDVTEREQASLERAYRNLRKMLARMNAEGVTLLAGSHAPIPLIPYGYGLHQELARLSEAGLGHAEALRTATLHPARVMGRVDELGTVEEGKLADLVLLDADPLEEIRNTRRVRAVVIDGLLLERDRLHAMIDGAEEKESD